MRTFTESTLEEAAFDYLASLGWQVLFGPEIATGELALRNALLPRLMSGGGEGQKKVRLA